jgi:hypothetical protein
MASSARADRKEGVSLAKGPVGLLGAVLLAYGILAFVFGGNSFTASFPDGTVNGDTFLGIEGNGWTNLIFAASGALLLFGSPFHWGAKSTALIVGLILGACSVIAMFDGWAEGDVLGIAAMNDWTILAMGASAAYLLITALLPRVSRDRDRDRRDERPADRPVVSDRDRVGGTSERIAEDRVIEADRSREGRFDADRTRTGGRDPQVEAAMDAERGRR